MTGEGAIEEKKGIPLQGDGRKTNKTFTGSLVEAGRVL